ncbi:putative bifunctional diguanylate cyclase/phosphodiesterase [Thiobacillus sedimenti]|uniref:EAL domain-containing protein n=1 Tax=Thiobacillus sedimenti TaxID=3110231 RepID=A0ABZ1CML6_9PROT|nr:EAL domain-containing protein [Thiobacillus sp. SCUT-2]WRS40521.1 EAL domain-containing protein [Thiobacillus sp. SCUT-2]
MTRRFLLLAWLLWGLAAPAAWAIPVKVGVFDNAPIVATPRDGAPEGIAIDVIRWVAEREGWQVSFVPDSFDHLLSRLDKGEIDLLVGIAYSEERARRFQFTRQSLLANWGMVFRNAQSDIASLPDLKGRRVALMRGSTHSQALVELAAQFDAAFTPVYVDSYAQVLEAVAERRADAGAVNRVFAAVHAHDANVVATSIVYNPIFVHFAAPKQASPALLAALDKHLAALKADPESAYYASLSRWLEAAPAERYPVWLPWAAGGAAGLLGLTLAAAAFLRRQVRRQTGELQQRAEQLQSEIEQRRSAQQHLNRIAYHDSLTELPNREAFRLELDTMLAERQGTEERLALLFIDVDRLKNVNDGLGHGAGDLLLQQVASRLRGVLRAHDYLSRFGGDEFVAIVSDIGESCDAELVASRLLSSLALPIDIGPTHIYSSVSIGIALYPDDATTADTLLKHADTAMYQAKEQGGSRFLFYHAQQTARVVERLTLETRLRQALEQGELTLHYQPIVALDDRRIVGAEALVRWNDPEKGLVMPGAFVPAAEDTGLIVPLGEWVLEAGCAQMRAWQKQGWADDITLAVNVSTRQFEGRRLVQSVERALARTGLAPAHLELEITENVMLIVNDDVRLALAALREMGVRLSLDDFGTGYSSLSYLKQLPFHSLKIDQSFVSRIPGQAGDTQIVTTILALAKGLELETVAEGIETQAQYDFLREHGCEFGQGYLMSRPLDAADFAARLGSRPRRGRR